MGNRSTAEVGAKNPWVFLRAWFQVCPRKVAWVLVMLTHPGWVASL